MSEIIPPSSEIPNPRLRKAALIAFDVCLVLLILTGIFFRFNWVNWNQDTDLHPDEYGLTSTLTALNMPHSLDEYFNTRLSPISPYQKYDENGSPTINGPDNRMRWGQWPIIIIRGTAEALNGLESLANGMGGSLVWNFTGYGEMRLMGRSLSALADTLSLLMIFLIGERLYGRRAGLLAAALSALAVMEIQQSHFMTVDNFAGFFTMVALYACVRIAQAAPVVRTPGAAEGQVGEYQPAWRVLGWYALFGVGFGMALASKINLAPLGGMVLVAALISALDIKLKSMDDLRRIFNFSLLFIVLAVLASLVTFRLTQPMSFRASVPSFSTGSGLLPELSFVTVPGDTNLLTISLNPDWFDSMKVAQAESNGDGGGPPGEQWAHRTPVVFALVNMVMWGMGVPLGLACWLAFLAALWQLCFGRNWRAHLIPLVWAGGYFGFMGTRWVMSTRYFLPIYQTLCLLAAWGLLSLWGWARAGERASTARRLLAGAAIGVTVLGSLAWASSFVQAVYSVPHTRIQAAHWIFQNIAGPFHLALQDEQGNTVYEPLSAQDGQQISSTAPYATSFVAPFNGLVTQVTLPHVQASGQTHLHLVISASPDGQNPLGQTDVSVGLLRSEVTGSFENVRLIAGQNYFLYATVADASTVYVFQNVISNESWDEGLPMRFEGHDPFGGLYRGLTMEVRWPDDENKKQMFLDVLGQVDYVILPSQRAIWSTCRIPLTYPMTMDYYRALFDGRLGFDQVAAFSAPLKLGPLEVSDVGGTFAWNQTPSLPLFNHSWLAAEEAFSVYDHPPVWIFRKRPDFSLDNARAILDKTDLSRVQVQGPREAQGDWCPAQ